MYVIRTHGGVGGRGRETSSYPDCAYIKMTIEKKFEHDLEVFRNEIESTIQFFYCYLAINSELSDSKEKLSFVNKTPLFWKTNISSLQVSFFITLGRIFDKTSKHNVFNLLKTARKHQSIFSKAALKSRKEAGSANAHEWITDYMKGMYVPKESDFDRLDEYVQKYSNLYDANYRMIRNKIFAHQEFSKPEQREKLFKKTDIKELEKILVFLKKLYLALWELYANGRKPKLRPLLFSFKSLKKKAKKQKKAGLLQQRIIEEAIVFFDNNIKNQGTTNHSTGLAEAHR